MACQDDGVSPEQLRQTARELACGEGGHGGAAGRGQPPQHLGKREHGPASTAQERRMIRITCISSVQRAEGRRHLCRVGLSSSCEGAPGSLPLSRESGSTLGQSTTRKRLLHSRTTPDPAEERAGQERSGQMGTGGEGMLGSGAGRLTRWAAGGQHLTLEESELEHGAGGVHAAHQQTGPNRTAMRCDAMRCDG